jgi:NDP-sugar pyrophosphorylase family protein
LIDQDYYDIYEYHSNHKNELTVVAAFKHMQIPYGTLESGENGELISLKEKPELTFMINTGMYILEPHLLNDIEADSFLHITDLIDRVCKRGGKVGVFPVSEGAWMDIGEWKEYNKTMVKLGVGSIDL